MYKRNKHIITKRLTTLNAYMRILGPLLIRNQCTTLNTKHLIYISLLKPIRMYGLQLWGTAKRSNTN